MQAGEEEGCNGASISKVAPHPDLDVIDEILYQVSIDASSEECSPNGDGGSNEKMALSTLPVEVDEGKLPMYKAGEVAAECSSSTQPEFSSVVVHNNDDLNVSPVSDVGELISQLYPTAGASSPLRSPKAWAQTHQLDLDNVSTRQMYLGVDDGSLTPGGMMSPDFSFTFGSPRSDDSPSLSGRSSSTFTDQCDDDDSVMDVELSLEDYSRLDRYGFIVDPMQKYSSSNGAMTNPPPSTIDDENGIESKEGRRLAHREAQRAVKWIKMVERLEASGETVNKWPSAHRKFRNRLVKGIPDCLRSKLWCQFLGIGESSMSVEQKQEYGRLFMKISGFERQIDLDIERTLRDHILFKARFSSAQVSLFKVLVAYSNLDPEVGYCQGMSTVVAFILLYLDEDRAFAFYRHLMQRSDLRAMYTPGFPLLFESFYVQERLLATYVPKVYARLSYFSIATSIYSTKWYLTMYLGCLPFSIAMRVWDLFLFWGADILVCVALALLRIHQKRLLRLEYEPCMQILGRLPELPVDEDKFIRAVWDVYSTVTADHGSDAFTMLRDAYSKSKDE